MLRSIVLSHHPHPMPLPSGSECYHLGMYLSIIFLFTYINVHVYFLTYSQVTVFRCIHPYYSLACSSKFLSA
jgi:hypothetical protein